MREVACEIPEKEGTLTVSKKHRRTGEASRRLQELRFVAQALLGKAFRVTQHRGDFVESSLAPYVMATLHPSAILRAPEEKERHEQERRFVEDLKKIAQIRL